MEEDFEYTDYDEELTGVCPKCSLKCDIEEILCLWCQEEEYDPTNDY